MKYKETAVGRHHKENNKGVRHTWDDDTVGLIDLQMLGHASRFLLHILTDVNTSQFLHCFWQAV